MCRSRRPNRPRNRPRSGAGCRRCRAKPRRPREPAGCGLPSRRRLRRRPRPTTASPSRRSPHALREAGETGRKRIAVIGAAPGVGTTATAVALARTLAEQARVILVDLSLERPSLAAITTDPRAPGVADLVRGTASFGQIITRDRFSRVQVVAAGRVGADAATVVRLGAAAHRRSRRCRAPTTIVVIDAGAAPNVPADRIARLAPCGVLVASGQASAKADAVRDLLGNAGFDDIAVFTGTPPALDAEAARGVAA